MTTLRRVAAAATAALVAVALPLVPASPAAADESYPVTVDGLPIVGHGYGHGRGMGQWGAQGAALQGIGYRTILGHYYPGTAVGALPADDRIRVLISQDGDGVLEIHAEQGLRVSDTNGWSAPLPAGPSRWRVVAAGASQVQVQRLDGGTWSDFSGPMQSPWFTRSETDGSPARVRLAWPDGSSRAYRGELAAVRSGAGVQTVNRLSMQQYLYGVVPAESIASWELEALKAQAVAARTYAAYKRRTTATSTYDICSTTACQVYFGSAAWTASGAFSELEHPRTTAAVNATPGEVRLYNGLAALTEFSASTGGWNTAGHVPYLRAQPDPWDDFPGNPVHTWTTTITRAAVEQKYPAVGSLRRIRVTGRDGNGEWGGRITTLVLEGVTTSGAPTSVTTTGPALRSALGLRSEWWTVNAGAIQLKWMELGGSQSVLGRPTSGEYDVPGGRAQDFERGRVYWSPATGAREVHGDLLARYLQLGGPGGPLRLPVSDEEAVRGGARSRFQGGHLYWSPSAGSKLVLGGILEKYLALGGPDSALGLPTTDEVDHAGGRRSAFAGGRIYWSGATGARAVQGAIAVRYVALGEAAGVLGFPVSDEGDAPGGRVSRFQRGQVLWGPSTGAWEVYGGILGAYSRVGGPAGPLGLPTTGEQAHGEGRRNRFAGGGVYWSARTDARAVYGAIAAKYVARGEAVGPLGWPLADEQATPGGRVSVFDRGRIYWSAAGAYEVRGAVLGTYLALGGSGGLLGVPVSDEEPVPGGVQARFAGGRVYWSPASGAHPVYGAILGRYLAEGGPGGRLGMPTSDEYSVPEGRRSDFVGGSLVYRAATGEVVLVPR